MHKRMQIGVLTQSARHWTAGGRLSTGRNQKKTERRHANIDPAPGNRTHHRHKRPSFVSLR